jgi:F420-dependent oxidoreductase-like protein
VDEEVDVRINLMIEGQEDVAWPQWRALAEAAEQVGLEGLFRSDHYQSVADHADKGSLDAWGTLTALGALTERLRLGTLVSPTSFRHPSVLAKAAVTADHVSGGRIEFGIGAGWHELEHRTYGFPFHDVGTRFDVLEEQLEIVVRQLTQERFDFDGRHYTLTDCEARPKPVQERLPVIVGGNAGPRSAAIAARWADEYNTVFPSVDQARERREAVVRACDEAGRDPLTFSMMIGCVIGEDDGEVEDRARRLHEVSRSEQPFEPWLERREEVWLVGTVEQVAESLDAYEQVGVERVMLQQLLHDDTDAVRLLGRL